jgi:hypothetical protein
MDSLDVTHASRADGEAGFSAVGQSIHGHAGG